MSTKGDKTGNDDEDEDNNLDNTKEVLETETPLQGGSVQEPCKGDAGEADESQSPSRWLNIGSSKNVFTEDERVPSRPSCIDCDHGEKGPVRDSDDDAPSRTPFAANTEVMRNRGLRKRYSR